MEKKKEKKSHDSSFFHICAALQWNIQKDQMKIQAR